MNLLDIQFPFSFLYDDTPFVDHAPALTEERCGDTLTRTYTLPDGLKVTNILTFYPEHGAYEWVNRFENTGTRPTGILSDLWDCDVTLPMEQEAVPVGSSYLPDKASATKIFFPNGSNWSKWEFCADDIDAICHSRRQHHIYPGETATFATTGGRGSQSTAPFFNICKNGAGYIGAIGWSGQWNAHITREEYAVRIRTGLEDACFRIFPGETFRTSSMVLMPYTGDPAEGQMRWRRLVKEHFSQIGTPGRAEYGPFCAGIWGGMRTQSMLDRVAFIRNNQLPFEYFWVDAGWYGRDTLPNDSNMDQEWSKRTGDWQVSPLIHPQGMEDVARAVKEAGMEFLLWVEIERARKTAPVAWEHPEYYLDNGREEDDNLLLDLGEERTYAYCLETLRSLITRLELGCLRIDYNLDPLEYWRKKDRPGRKGISEIYYINNLYRLWDQLLADFPGLVIDNCSSGGMRIDIELNRRSIPLWRTDYACHINCDPDGLQNHHLSFGNWLPYTGTGCGNSNTEYGIRSAYDSAMMCFHTFLEMEQYDTPENTAFLQKYGAEYLRVRPYFSEDFYPLTKTSQDTEAWVACQFDRPAQQDGLVQVFKREESPFETAVFFLRGLDEAKTYRFTDLDGGEFILTGVQLNREGLRVTITEKPKAKIWIYQAL